MAYYKTLAELQAVVLALLNDSAYSTTTITTYLNRCVRELSSYYQLPLLKTSSNVTTSTSLAYVAMPSAYQRDLYQVYSAANDDLVRIYRSWADFIGTYPNLDESGNVADVCVVGSNLYYNPIPSVADTLTLYYYKMPTDMAASGSYPDGIPSMLQEILLCNYAAREIDKIRGLPEKVAMWDREYQRGLGMLMAHTVPEDYHGRQVGDNWDEAG